MHLWSIYLLCVIALSLTPYLFLSVSSLSFHDSLTTPHPLTTAPFRTVLVTDPSHQDGVEDVAATSSVWMIRDEIPTHWHRVRRANPQALMRMTLSLTHPQAVKDNMEQLFWEVSDPAHVHYGAYLSYTELMAATQPSAETLEAIYSWLEQHGVEHIRNATTLDVFAKRTLLEREQEQGQATTQTATTYDLSAPPTRSGSFDMLSFTVSVHQAERLLRTEYYEYQFVAPSPHHTTTSRHVIRAQQFAVPQHIAPHLDVISPTYRFPPLQLQRGATVPTPTPSMSTDEHAVASYWTMADTQNAKPPHTPQLQQQPQQQSLSQSLSQSQSPSQWQSRLDEVPACAPYVDLVCLRWLYNTQNYVTWNSNNSIACTGFDQQYINGQDLENFFDNFDPMSVNRSVYVVGPNDQSNPGGEATQDVQLMMGMSSGTVSVFWSTGGSQPHGPDAGEPFLQWLMDLSSSPQVPWVFSTSYGDDERDLDFNYLTRVNFEFIKAGLRGVTILFASGDGGVAGGSHVPDCNTAFVAVFPAASPYVTAVGGTTLVNNNTDNSTAPVWVEVAASFSSGGFSNLWPQPYYQKKVVVEYLCNYGHDTLPTPPTLYNATSRAFPDVASMSYNLPTYIHGGVFPTMGTSNAAPLFGAIVSFLNDIRLNAGQPSMGFLNPWIYAHTNETFNDITIGNNPGCGTNGFYAAEGWDPITGFGTPNFIALAEALQL